MQLKLFSQTADKTQEGADAEAERGEPRPVTDAGAKREKKNSKAKPILMLEEIADVENLKTAFKKVAQNQGAPGPDGKSIEEISKHLSKLLPGLSAALLKEDYRPGEVRRVWIPKPGGGIRGLGIPDVIDRLVQQAVLQILQSHYDREFDKSSHGFRPGKSCHTALAEAKQYVEQGYEWVVDIDLEKFFDTVNHQRLLDRLERKIADRRIIRLIHKMLKAGTAMPDGVVVKNEEGTPQGGPLSPLLSNIVLDELDAKLRERGHKFVRYADDCNIYVRSERAGQRVFESTERFIEKRLRLKVNRRKSAVARPSERHFLGFRLENNIEQGTAEIKLSKRTRERINARIKELTPRNWGQSMKSCIDSLNQYLKGWAGFFGICGESESRTFLTLDAHIRRRLRAVQLKQWKCKRSIVRQLIKLGAGRKAAWRGIYGGHRSLWKLSHTPVVDRTLNNSYFARSGLVSLQTLGLPRRQSIGVSIQLVFGYA